MSTISKLVLPVKSGDTITNIEYDLPSGGGGLPTAITNPQDGQLLKYDATEGAWVNAGFSTTSVGSASTGTAIDADDITAWSAGTVPTLGTAIAADDITAWDAGSTPTLGTAIAADDITAWTTNTPTAVSVSGEKLTITAGTAASLSYTARSIPNVTGVGSKPSLTYTARSIPNVTSVGTAPSLTYTAKSIPNISVTPTTVVTGVN